VVTIQRTKPNQNHPTFTHKTRAIMFEDPHKQKIFVTGIHLLPNEILINIASFFSITELRGLSKVNKRLSCFVQDYLDRYRYNAVIWAIPNEILVEVVQWLGCQRDRSCLARSCRKFYPIITDYIFRHNVRYNRSSLLNHAAERNLKVMTRRILRVGGDLETRLSISRTAGDKRLTPLTTAALHGHLGLVRILLEAGASQFLDGSRIPLVVAILSQHEPVALLLSQQLHASVAPLGKSPDTVLQIASEAKLPRLVEHYLNDKGSQSPRQLDNKHVHNLSNALVRILLVDFSYEDLVKRKIDNNAYRIVLMLLQQGASPDIRIQIESYPVITARVIASRHPDPRIRNLLSPRMAATTSVNIRPLVGRLWMSSQGDGALTLFASQSHIRLWSGSSSAGMLRTVRRLQLGGSASAEANDLMRGSTRCKEIPLDASDIDEMVRREHRKPKRSLDLHPLDLTTECSFPQLACPSIGAQSASKKFWAQIPVMNPRPISHTASAHSILPTVKQSEKSSYMEPFPQLTEVDPRSNDVAKDVWASFSKRKVAQDTDSPHGPPADEEVDQAKRQSHKSTKQKKWVPLLL
jgi:ankyrin repeat protein